jgi:UDP-arabinose 4-epimerase
MSESVLVAGGAGFIGSHTAKLLKASGYEPVVVDNLITGNRSAVRFGAFHEGGIEDAALVREAIITHGIRRALLFAAHAYVGESTASPRKYYGNNIANNLRFLDTLLDAGVRELVFSSSCSVYGTQPTLPLVEDSPTDPLSPYAQTKLFLESVLGWYGSAYGLRSVCLRYFNAAGADPEGELGEQHDPETHLIPLAIFGALRGQELSIFGDDYPTQDGTCVRDYIHVSDLAQAHVQALRYLAAGGSSTILNLGAETGHSIREVIAEVEKVSGRKVPVRMAPRRVGDAPILVASCAKARSVLGWQQRWSDLPGIVRHAWNWFSAHEA